MIAFAWLSKLCDDLPPPLLRLTLSAIYRTKKYGSHKMTEKDDKRGSDKSLLCINKDRHNNNPEATMPSATLQEDVMKGREILIEWAAAPSTYCELIIFSLPQHHPCQLATKIWQLKIVSTLVWHETTFSKFQIPQNETFISKYVALH